MSKKGKELVAALVKYFGGVRKAAAETGLNRTTLQKWGTGKRSPNTHNLEKYSVYLQSDNPKSREARILNYRKQITESKRIKWQRKNRS